MQNIQKAVNLVRSGILVCYSEVNDTKETEMEFDIMDMTKLFEDFKNHVEQLDDDAIKQSISRAVEHSINSSSLEYEAEKSDGIATKRHLCTIYVNCEYVSVSK